MKTICLTACLCLLAAYTCQAQLPHNDSLYLTIMQNDSLLFGRGFNHCEIEYFRQLTDTDFEFYHDQSGTTLSQTVFIEGIENGLCNMPYQAQRRLDKESVEMFVLKNNGEVYGVLQNGFHSFYAIESNREPYLTSTARFSHLWLLKDGRWVLSRVLSYDHQAP